VNIDKHGPRVALERMQKEGISTIYVTDSARNLKGYVTADDAVTALRSEVTSLAAILKTDTPSVTKDTLMNAIFDISHDAPVPITVVEDGKLLGIIVRGAVIAALSGQGEVNLTHA